MSLQNSQQRSFSGMIFALISVINVRKKIQSISQQEMFHEIQTFGNYRKRWYQRAMDMEATQWRTISRPSEQIPTTTANNKLWENVSKSAKNILTTNATFWKSISRSSDDDDVPIASNPNTAGKLRKCSSLSVASSFTRVCLCAPISSYSEVFRVDHYVPSRRSNSYPRSKPFSGSHQERINPNIGIPARLSSEGRRVFRGKSLTDNVLMRRFVVEEQAMMQVRRKNQMEVIRKRSTMRKKKLGPSPLSRMVLVEE